MQLSDIDISLSLGQLIWKKQFKAILLFIILLCIFPIISIIMLFFPIEWNSQIILVLVIINLLCLAMMFLPIYLLIRDYNNKKQIKLWLNDIIEIKAYSRALGEYKSLFLPKGIVIQVEFKIDEKKYIKNSTIKVFGGGTAYLATFKKYADREIKILYSPKYDQVLILKD